MLAEYFTTEVTLPLITLKLKSKSVNCVLGEEGQISSDSTKALYIDKAICFDNWSSQYLTILQNVKHIF